MDYMCIGHPNDSQYKVKNWQKYSVLKKYKNIIKPQFSECPDDVAFVKDEDNIIMHIIDSNIECIIDDANIQDQLKEIFEYYLGYDLQECDEYLEYAYYVAEIIAAYNAAKYLL